MSEVFYITAMIAILNPKGLSYHVITNAGTSFFDSYEDLPILCKRWLDKYGGTVYILGDGVTAIYKNV